MIAPITKEYFYKCVGKVEKWKKLFGIELVKDDDPWFDVEITPILYLEYLGLGYFVYLPSFGMVAIPDQYDFTVSGNEQVMLDDWLWKETGVKHNEDYTINLFHRTSSIKWRYDEDTFKKISEKYPSKVEILLHNDRIGFSKKVELRIENNEYWKNFYIAYKDKLELPIDGIKINKEEIEITNILLWSQKKH